MAHRVRVAELAGVLGVTPAQVLAVCRRLKIPVAAAESVLDRSECEIIKRELSNRSVSSRSPSAPSRQPVQSTAWRHLEQARQAGTSVRGRVTAVVKGGVTVDVGVRAFIPASQFDISYVDDLASYIGATVEARVLEVDPTTNNAVLSRRMHLEAVLEAAKAELLSSLQPGQERSATVSSVRSNGMAVDLGGLTAWVPISSIPVPAGQRLDGCYAAGERVSVTVCDVNAEEVVVSLYLAAADQTRPSMIDVPASRLSEHIAGRCSVADGALVVELAQDDCDEADRVIPELVDASVESGIRELRLVVPSAGRREVRSALGRLGPANHVASRRQVDGGFVLRLSAAGAGH